MQSWLWNILKLTNNLEIIYQEMIENSKFLHWNFGIQKNIEIFIGSDEIAFFEWEVQGHI